MPRPHLLFLIFSICLSAFQFGFNGGVINQPRHVITVCQTTEQILGHLPSCIPMNDWQWGLLVSIKLLGGAMGSFSAGLLAQKIGRLRTLMYNNIFFVMGGFLFFIASNPYVMYLARFCVGFGAGLGSAIVPMYISELTPIKARGAFGAMNELVIISGVLTAQALGLFLAKPLLWRYLLAFTIVPSILQAILLCFWGTESPRYSIRFTNSRFSWLIHNNKENEALDSLKKLRGNNSQCQIEWNDMRRLKTDQSRDSVLVTQMAQQFSGTNVGFHFSTTIFKKHFEHQVAVALTAGLTATNVVVLLICMCLIDRIGRRPLLLTSSLGMAFSSLALTCAAHFQLDPIIQAVFFMCFTGSYGAGLGMIPWLLPPELIPRYAIDSASSFSACFNWSSSLLVAFFIPILLTLACMFIYATIVAMYMPETRGKTAEETLKEAKE